MQAAEDKGRAVGRGERQSGLEVLLAEVTALAHQLQKKALVTHEKGDPGAGAWGVLEILDRLGPQTVPGMARMRGLSRQSIQVQVNRLRAEGRVELAPNPAHKRSGLVQLTEPGRGMLATMAGRNSSSLEALLPHLPEVRLVPATRLLRRIRELLVGEELPPVEAPGGGPARPRRGKSGTEQPRQAVPTLAPSQTASEPGFIESDENELPVSLL